MARANFAHREKNQSPSSPQQSNAAVQFALGGNVAQVPVEISDDLVFLPVGINGGRPSWFLLDTSRATSSIDDIRAAALGLHVPGSGDPAGKFISNATLDFPGLRITIPSLALESFGDLSSRIGHAVDGVLGADAVGQLVVAISYDRQSVRFYDPKSFQYFASAVKLPLQLLGGVPVIEAKVSVPHRGSFHGLFSIATGQTEAIQFAPHFASSHDLRGSTERTIPFFPDTTSSDSDSAGRLGRLREIQFGKITLSDPIAAFPGKSASSDTHIPSDFAGSLGGKILNRFNIYIDYPAHLLYLEPNKHFPDRFVEDMSGLVLVAIPPAFHAFEVAQVIPKSPAEDAGMAAGDMIEKIDGNPTSEGTLDDIRALLCQGAVQHVFTVRRNGKLITFTFTLKPLL
ncbi:MAG TPA: PDZ domain-containing protein [Candidatus Acidoferrales bacterium]|nr:PDZ domain-containing protein [Candidatus Acidoferrales bacterium]